MYMAKLKKILCCLLSLIVIFGGMVSKPIVALADTSKARDIEISLAADAVSNNLDLNGFSDKLKNVLNTTYGIPADKVHIITPSSTTSSAKDLTWEKVDHTNVSGNAVNNNNDLVTYYNDQNYDPNYTNDGYVDGWALNQPYHISTSSDGSTITFDGYGSPAYKDFLYTANSNADNKIFNFQIDEANVQYHSADGSGFLFGANYTSNNGTRTLSGYIVLIGENDIGLYELKGIDVNQFTKNDSGTTFFSKYGEGGFSEGNNSAWGGTVTCLKTLTKPNPSSGKVRYLKLVASPTAVSLYQFADSGYNTTSSDGVILNNISLPDVFSGFGFGPIASYAQHSCPQGTESVFSNIKLTEDTSTSFADVVRSTAWQYKDSQKVIVNVDNDGVTDFGDNATLGSTLYYMMKNNTSYIGWGINNNININGYNTVKDQANGFIARNEGNGTFINRSDSNTSTLDQGVNAIAAYIAGQQGSLKGIDKPNLTTTINSNGNVTSKTNDTTTSKGNPIGGYKWKTLDIVSGQWKDETANTNSASLNFAQNTYSMVGLSIQDSVTGEWSDFAYSYIATTAAADPISQFTIDKTSLMPDSSVAALKTGTVVTAADSSYIPNGGAIAAYEWSVLDAGLNPIVALGKSYTNSNIPSSLQFDFAAQPAGTYTIRLRTQNSSGTWSPYYTQKVTIYKESSAVSISTTNNTTGINVYSNSTAIPFTIASTGGNITSYRAISVSKSGETSIGDWKKVNLPSVNDSQTITNTSCDEYVQAIDAAGNSKTQFVGSYYLPLSVSADYDGTNTAYVSNTATNKNIVFTTNNTGVEFSVDGGKTFTAFTSPLKITSADTYIFRYINDSNSSNYVTITANIKKDFQAKVSGVEDQAKYVSAVTPVIENATAVITKDNGTATPFTSNTQIIDDGKYSLVVTDEYGNTKTINFIIDKVNPVVSVTGNPSSWTNQDVTLSINNIVGISGVKSLTVQKDGGAETDITGQNSYKVSENGTYVFKAVNGIGQSTTTTVNVTKIDKRSLAAPTNPVQDDKTNTFAWTNVDGWRNAADYEYSVDNGATWTTVTANPQQIPDKTYAKGTVQVRVKADSNTGKPAGAALSSAAEYIQTPTAVTGSLIDGNSNNQISKVTATVTPDSNGNNTVSINASEAVAVKQADGTISSLGDLSKVTISSANGSSIAVSADGTIKLNNIANGTDNSFDITYDLGNGQKVVIGKIEVKVSSTGAVSLESTLIDPYGIITDSVTGKPISGVNITLYYADTARNRAAGKTPGTIVQLPEIVGFKPNNNKNPQVSDASGAYGYMVFPNTDYYVVATKDGYNQYTSPTISVGTDIVKFDVTMTKTVATTVTAKATLPQTGSPIDMEVFIVIGMLIMAAGIIVLKRGFSIKSK